ncbi:MAG: exodeoxyribonuclease VII small subunit [Aliidiomarina sp.]|uniref:exodeoxyribonuclease VII small subunit n=1 Tax=Aliidiomarina sp. TaxID=1872439 RepID=UPI0025C60D96|nr:exodeoxyribonuclease VII small subunit [Aliidiomarina sp.]MCH8501925.1 exodeoxyribonuclease VII small subunit [Aliidiomarina sp.]
MSQKEANQLDFEQAMQELEGIIKELESGDLSLENSLQKFERAVLLTRVSQDKLSKAEQRVQQLLQQNGNESLQALTSNNENNDGLPF